jgi:tyrosine-protein phosphatase non-receptor type 11
MNVGGKAGFWEEFEELQQCESSKHSLPRKEGQRMENRPKNRYKNILPCNYLHAFDFKVFTSNDLLFLSLAVDHSRIVLKCDWYHAKPGTDYINANRIIYDEKALTGGGNIFLSYIATQGCLPNTIEDFWCMIWSEKSFIIVMTTKEVMKTMLKESFMMHFVQFQKVERGRVKCAKYWPDLNETTNLQDFSILNLKEDNFPNYVLRHLQLTHVHTGEKRVIFHFHFKVRSFQSVRRNNN